MFFFRLCAVMFCCASNLFALSENSKSFLAAIETFDKFYYAQIIHGISKINLFPSLTKSYITDAELEIKYLPSNIAFLDERIEQLLFHGTKSTIQILDEKALKAFRSQTGYGIFFGRNFETSAKYFTDKSSNINQTWLGGPLVRSVLIFTKDPSKIFIKNNNEGTFNMVAEYLLKEETYSIDNLKTIAFAETYDVDKFSNYFAMQTDEQKNRLKQLEFYDCSYLPMKNSHNLNLFKNELEKYENELFNDIAFIEKLLSLKPIAIKDKDDLIMKMAKAEAPKALYFAIKYQILPAVNYIVNNLNDEDLLTYFIGEHNLPSPMEEIINNGNDKIFKIILGKFSEKSLSKIAEILSSGQKKAQTNPLKNALKKDNEALLALFIEKFINYPKIRETILSLIVNREVEDEALSILFKKLANETILMERFENDETLALTAAKNSHDEILKFIADKAPVSLEMPDNEGNFPLLFVAELGSTTYLQKLLSKSENMAMVQNFDGDTIAHKAVKSGGTRLAYILERKPELALVKDNRGDTPAHLAASNIEFIENFKYLVEKFPKSMNVPNKAGWLPATIATHNQNVEALKYLNDKIKNLY
jgi:hypothetical protein